MVASSILALRQADSLLKREKGKEKKGGREEGEPRTSSFACRSIIGEERGKRGEGRKEGRSRNLRPNSCSVSRCTARSMGKDKRERGGRKKEGRKGEETAADPACSSAYSCLFYPLSREGGRGRKGRKRRRGHGPT